MSMHIQGKFLVKLSPLPEDPVPVPAIFGRRAIAKVFEGELAGESYGVMLAHRPAVDGSGGYVALERFSGTLCGRRGSFVLQHFGIMDRGEQSLQISVVPDSAENELVGLRGDMKIDILNGEHFYRFEYHFVTDS